MIEITMVENEVVVFIISVYTKDTSEHRHTQSSAECCTPAVIVLLTMNSYIPQ